MSAALDAVARAAAIARSRAPGRTPILAIAGAQGSGKSTLAADFCTRTPGAAHLALDDFYLTKQGRAELAREAHPLFATRGVPGTHDIHLLGDTIGALMNASPQTKTPLPRFDKVADDRKPSAQCGAFVGRPSLIVLEGWCLGASAAHERTLTEPINALEREEDADGAWRKRANQYLAGPYQDFFVCLDAIMFLAAPSFDAVLDWRCEQEAGLLGRALTSEDRARVARFVAHYERLTRHMLAGGRRADIVVALDKRRNVASVRETT